MKKPLKAFILAAGFGTRLRPLTDSCPKVLLPFFGVPLLFLLLEQLAKLDIEEIFVNGHYLSEQIRDAIKAYPLSKKVSFCHEEQILGTAGPFRANKKELGECNLLVMNGDIITDLNLQSLVNKHEHNGALATMGLLQNIPPAKTSVWCDHENILGFGVLNPSPRKATGEHSFAGAQVLSSEFLRAIPTGPSEVIPLYKQFIEQGRSISYFVSNPIWFDIGSPDAFFDAHIHTLPLLGQKKFMETFPLQTCWKKLGFKPIYSDLKKILVNKSWNGPYFSKKDVFFGADTSIGPGVVNLTDYNEFPDNTQLKNSLLLPGARIQKGDNLEGLILSGAFRIHRASIK